MMKIDISTWQEFKISEIFKYKRGNNVNKENHIPGDIAYISSTKENNGISNYIQKPLNIETTKNAITLNNNGSVGYCFYHFYHFIASSDCTILTLKNREIDNFIFLFLKPIIEKFSKIKYSYGRKISNNKLKNEIIFLPTKNNQPDWQFMKAYIQNKAKNVIYDKIVQYPKNIISLNSVKWQEFKISDLFYVVGTKTTPKLTLNEYSYGDHPYITTRATNNGIDGFYGFKTENGNVLTIDSATIGHTTYQEAGFSASDHVEKLVPICYKKMNKYIALFFKTILNKEQYRYGYGRKFNQTRIKETVINLPVVSKDLPDWQFMEDYIKSLPYSKSL